MQQIYLFKLTYTLLYRNKYYDSAKTEVKKRERIALSFTDQLFCWNFTYSL